MTGRSFGMFRILPFCFKPKFANALRCGAFNENVVAPLDTQITSRRNAASILPSLLSYWCSHSAFFITFLTARSLAV